MTVFIVKALSGIDAGLQQFIKPVLIIELKYEKDADGAGAQIKRQQYPDRLEAYEGNTLLVE